MGTSGEFKTANYYCDISVQRVCEVIMAEFCIICAFIVVLATLSTINPDLLGGDGVDKAQTFTPTRLNCSSTSPK
jgi:hypothetical protein